MSDIVETIPIADGPVMDALDKFFRNQHIAECVAAETRQRRAAKELGDNRKSINGLGRPRMEIDEAVLAHWRVRLGHNPLRDSGWIKYMERHFPEVRVKSTGTHEIFAGYGTKSSGVTKRFAKSYGC